MKQLFILFSLCLVIVFTLGGESVFAQAPPPDKIPTGVTTAQGLVDLVKIITDWVFVVLVVVAIIFIILAAFQFVTGGGDPAAVGEARTKLIWAAVGIGVALLSRGFSGAIEDIVGQVPLPAAGLHLKFEVKGAEGEFYHADAKISDTACDLGNGKCLMLDGTDDQVTVDEKKVAIPKNGPATIAGWYKLEQFANAKGFGIFFHSLLYQHTANDRPYIANGAADFFYVVAPDLKVNTWHSLILTYHGDSRSAKLYVDCKEFPPNLQPPFPAGNHDIPALVGFYVSGGGPNAIKGQVDDVRVYNQVLTKKQINALCKK
ncbi:MAG: LamG-like jellyroll fold domain-containing protein [Patescibacteria group bacterium]